MEIGDGGPTALSTGESPLKVVLSVLVFLDLPLLVRFPLWFLRTVLRAPLFFFDALSSLRAVGFRVFFTEPVREGFGFPEVFFTLVFLLVLAVVFLIADFCDFCLPLVIFPIEHLPVAMAIEP